MTCCHSGWGAERKACRPPWCRRLQGSGPGGREQGGKNKSQEYSETPAPRNAIFHWDELKQSMARNVARPLLGSHSKELQLKAKKKKKNVHDGNKDILQGNHEHPRGRRRQAWVASLSEERRKETQVRQDRRLRWSRRPWPPPPAAYTVLDRGERGAAHLFSRGWGVHQRSEQHCRRQTVPLPCL